jgi:hypothetical protein
MQIHSLRAFAILAAGLAACAWASTGSAADVKTVSKKSSIKKSAARTDGGCEAAPSCGDDSCSDCDSCDSAGLPGHRRGCRCEGCRLFSARRANNSFNCTCNGSYKFPVPPLYTYHWPGMYSEELMTNYRSPWRFPPLKPYVDEPKGEVSLEDTARSELTRPRLLPTSEESDPVRPLTHVQPRARKASSSR